MPFRPTARIEALPPYLFVEIDRKRREAVDAGHDVIDFGVGDPDLPTPRFIIDRMNRALEVPENHRYPFGGGSRRFRAAMAEFFAKRYGVQLDPAREILALIGSKEGIGHLPLAVVNPQDAVLIPTPAYPVYRSGTLFADGVPHIFELKPERGWLPDLDELARTMPKNAVLLFLNYPNNPTGGIATLDFFAEVVEFARAHDLIVAHDAAYNEMYLGETLPPSILQVPGARDVAVEFHSASKTFNMTGWRIGFAAGNADVVSALGRIKSNLDSGAFGAVQEAAQEAYAGFERPEIAELRQIYRTRGELLCRGLRGVGFDAQVPDATFYVWARIPAGYDSMSLCNRLIEEVHIVGVPGIGFGPSSEGYMRFSLSVPTERIEQAVERLKALKL